MQKHKKGGFDAVLKEFINTLKDASWDAADTRDIDKVEGCRHVGIWPDSNQYFERVNNIIYFTLLRSAFSSASYMRF